MSLRRLTIIEQRYPETFEFQEAANRLLGDAVDHIMRSVWSGYDALKLEILDHLPDIERGEEGERSLTQLLAPRIDRHLVGFEAFYIQPGVKEMETRLPPPAQSPEYDLAFVLIENEKICWPLEAKFLNSDRALAAYVADINDEFLTCRYAPFSAGGAMIGYLLRGSATRFLGNVAGRLGVEMTDYEAAAGRPHRTTRHPRTVPPNKSYPANFTCHHLVFALT